MSVNGLNDPIIRSHQVELVRWSRCDIFIHIKFIPPNYLIDGGDLYIFILLFFCECNYMYKKGSLVHRRLGAMGFIYV